MTDVTMDNFLRGVFVMEIREQCEFALRAAMSIEAEAHPRRKELWYFLHGFLVAAGNISKCLWNDDREEIKGRCQDLRDTLGLADDSPLKSRALRNHYEHYDHRLERWAIESRRHILVDKIFGPPGALNVDPTDDHRGFDPNTGTARFWGEEYPLRPLVKEIQRIKERIENKPPFG